MDYLEGVVEMGLDRGNGVVEVVEQATEVHVVGVEIGVLFGRGVDCGEEGEEWGGVGEEGAPEEEVGEEDDDFFG